MTKEDLMLLLVIIVPVFIAVNSMGMYLITKRKPVTFEFSDIVINMIIFGSFILWAAVGSELIPDEMYFGASIVYYTALILSYSFFLRRGKQHTYPSPEVHFSEPKGGKSMKVTKCDRCGVECDLTCKSFVCNDLSEDDRFKINRLDLCSGCAAALIEFLKNKEK